MMVKTQEVEFLWVYLALINFSGLNIPSSACKVVETLYSQCKLSLGNSIPSICTQTRQNCDKNSLCLPKDFTQTNRILHRHACGACDKFHVWMGIVMVMVMVMVMITMMTTKTTTIITTMSALMTKTTTIPNS